MVLVNFLAHSLKFGEKPLFFSKFHENAVIRVFWHVEFISALKTELNPTVFERNAKNKIKYIIIVSFYFFVIFSKSYQQNCIKTMESSFLDGKTPNSAEMVLVNFFSPQPSHRHTIVRAKIRRKTAFISKSHENAIIRVFWHVEFISALKTEVNLRFLRKNAKNKIKYLIIVIFYFL